MGRRWTGNEREQRQITKELDIAVQWARQHDNVPLFLGEFGAYSKADMNSRVRWTYFVARQAEKGTLAGVIGNSALVSEPTIRLKTSGGEIFCTH